MSDMDLDRRTGSGTSGGAEGVSILVAHPLDTRQPYFGGVLQPCLARRCFSLDVA